MYTDHMVEATSSRDLKEVAGEPACRDLGRRNLQAEGTASVRLEQRERRRVCTEVGGAPMRSGWGGQALPGSEPGGGSELEQKAGSYAETPGMGPRVQTRRVCRGAAGAPRRAREAARALHVGHGKSGREAGRVHWTCWWIGDVLHLLTRWAVVPS